jgi:hypothetical protein
MRGQGIRPDPDTGPGGAISIEAEPWVSLASTPSRESASGSCIAGEAQLGETLRLWRDDIDLGAATQRPANLTGREAVDNGRVRMREIGRIEIASSATMLANIVTSGGRGA